MATLKSLEIDVAAIFDVNRFGANYRSEQESDKSRRCSDAEAYPRQRRVPDCVITITACGDDKPGKQPCEPVDNSRLTTQVGPTLDHRPDRSRSLSYILDPRRINDHVISREPIVVVSKIVIDPIAVVVDVGLCESHAGKRYVMGRLSQLLTRSHFLHLHSSGGNKGKLSAVHFRQDIDFFFSRMDLVLSIFFYFFLNKDFSLYMVVLLF